MPSKKKETANTLTAEELSEAYARALEQYAGAVANLRAGKYDLAREALQQLIDEQREEPELAERAATYLRVCDQRLAPLEAAPDTPDGYYHTAVVRLNAGDHETAIRMLDEALNREPGSVRCLYARSSACALAGQAERAVEDLRQAIAIDPTVRFQAINDPDFERIREEPAFIDIVEPTPTAP